MFPQKPMLDIFSLLQCLIFELETTTLTRMSIVMTALLGMSGRVTMKGIARWAGKGGSYRTVQRFFNTYYYPGQLCSGHFSASTVGAHKTPIYWQGMNQ